MSYYQIINKQELYSAKKARRTILRDNIVTSF